MKNKLFTLLLALMASVGTMFAQSGTCGDNVTWNLTDGVLTISGTGAMMDYADATNTPWYEHKNSINSVYISAGVTTIGNRAFSGCKNMTTVTIPNSVISIGWYAFASSNLLSITIPKSVTELGIFPFHMCNSLTAIDVESDNANFCSIDGVLYLKDKTNLIKYPAAKSGTSYFIPDNVTEISDYAFSWCGNLTSIDIPNSVTRVNSYAFRNCTGLTSVTFPENVTYIGSYAFYSCSSLTSVVCMATNVPILSSTAFYGDINSLPLYVPAQSLEAYKAADVWKDFGTILSIEKTKDYLTIAEAIEIGMALDSMATSKETYTIEGYVINAASFNSKYKTQSWYMVDDLNATSSGFQAYSCYPIYGGDTVAVTNGSKVRMTGKLQKYYNKSTSSYLVEMTRVPATIIAEPQVADTLTIAEALAIGAELPAGGFTPVKYVIRGYVSYINAPFDETTGCETFYIADDISTPAYSNQTGGFYIYRGSPVTGEAIAQGALVEITTAIYNYHGTIIENYGQQIPVTVIQEAPECYTLTGNCGDNLTWTLSTCDGLLTISGTGTTYNYSKDNVAPWVYYDVQSAVIENGVTALGTYAFYKCSMSSVSIPASVTNIAFNTFNNCYNLMNFMVDPGNLVYSSVDGVLFNKDQTIIVRYPRGRKGEYTIPDGVVIVGEGAFNGCYNVTNVTIPNSVTTLGCAAFFSCGMSSITIPANVNRIDSLVFVGCQYLNVVTNYAIEPQVINTNVFDGDIDMSKCTLYVRQQSLAAYQAANVWKDFGSIKVIGDTIETEEANYNVVYKGDGDKQIYSESITLHLPIAPTITGFTFLKWQVVAGDLEDGIIIQAVYTADEPSSAPEVYTNPANSAQKLIRNGNVYILTGDKVYTITGQEVR